MLAGGIDHGHLSEKHAGTDAAQHRGLAVGQFSGDAHRTFDHHVKAVALIPLPKNLMLCRIELQLRNRAQSLFFLGGQPAEQPARFNGNHKGSLSEKAVR